MPFAALATAPLVCGKCELFVSGPPCDTYRNNETVFVDSSYQQSGTIDAVRRLVNHTQSTQFALCHPIIVRAVCLLLFPDCIQTTSGEATAKAWCKANCETVKNNQHKCAQDILNTLIQSISTLNNVWDSPPAHVSTDMFQCEFSSDQNQNCMNLIYNLSYTTPSPTSYKYTASQATFFTEGAKPDTPNNRTITCDSEGTAAVGSACVFPFIYKETSYTNCTTTDSPDERPWCHTETGNATEQHFWGYCDCPDGKAESETFETTVAFLVSFPSGIVMMLLLVLFIRWTWRKSRRGIQQEGLENMDTRATDTVDEIWDSDVRLSVRTCNIPSKALQIGETIGEGNFGTVYKGILRGSTTVAVKALKSEIFEACNKEAVNGFVREALRLRRFSHRNVMTLVGICWREYDLGFFRPLIVLPYLELGDLHTYLQRRRRACNKRSNKRSVMDEEVEDGFFEDNNQPVAIQQLVKFCHQIAKGMEYVSNQGVLHRDLAARNCMVTWELEVKVSDFGMARVLEDKDYYQMHNEVTLPVRWMAIESLQERLFFTASDVWSYGVTVWEVMTLGLVPYAGLTNFEVKAFVQSNGRLGRPDYCPKEVFNLASSCWLLEHSTRPTFSEIVETLEQYMSQSESYLCLNSTSDELEGTAVC